MLGRGQPGQAEVKFETGRQLTRRFESVQQAKKEFRSRWIEEAYPEMLKQHKWTRDKKDVKVGDIVLRKDETAAGQT
jgi:metal-responsive CopG/Arc/MetJ family transcriptional regulator